MNQQFSPDQFTGSGENCFALFPGYNFGEFVFLKVLFGAFPDVFRGDIFNRAQVVFIIAGVEVVEA
jgi:hypothetical protein